VTGPGPDDDPDDLTAEELNDAYELAAENVLAWLECRCDMHLWYVGVACYVPRIRPSARA
jgi:hypothetical protein